MSEIMLRSGIERLQSLLLDETAPLSESAKGDLNAILGELRPMKRLLKVKRRVNEIENRVRQIEELSYQIEDKIESTKIWEGDNVIKMHWHNLSSTIQKIIGNMNTIIKQIDNKATITANKPDLPQKITDPIGVEEDHKQLCQLLLSDSSSPVAVFAIYGVVGSGKTTLARLIYYNPEIAKKFEIRKWIDVPREFEVGYIQKKMMEGLMPYDSSEKQFHKIFSSTRSFIVLDDVRSTEAWETLSRALPELYPGSYLLVTTRVGYVAEKVGFVHNMRPLNESDSWALFNKVFLDRDPSGDRSSSHQSTILSDEATTSSTKKDTGFKGYGCSTFNLNLPTATGTNNYREMVSYCDGSPQLIKYLALYLQSEKQNQEWETLHKNTKAFLSELCLVYNELPEHLQPCFMHLGHFLEDPSIDSEKLSHLWMIEGLLSSRQRAVMDMTEQYLRELALQGMVEVQAEEVPATKKFKACRFVQGMENLCVSNCEEKGFLRIIDLRQEDGSLSSSDEPRRLVIYLGQHKVDIPPKVAKTIRSVRLVLLRNQQQIEGVCPTKMLKLKEFRVVRVLDFDGIYFPIPKLLADIFNLELLRYLSFKGCVLKELPSSISKLCYLRVLDLRVEGLDEIKIPNVLWKMRRLNHLYLPLKFATQNGEKLQLDSLTELETLVNFNTRLCRANYVSTLCKLRYLEAKVEENFSNFKSITNYMKTRASNNCPLQCSMDVTDLDCYAEERREVLLGFLLCKVVRALQFKGFIGLLPQISKNITQLVLNKSYLKEDPMPILEKLPSLGVLILSDDAYFGKKMVCSDSGFRQLKCLRLVDLSELKILEIDDMAMPILSHREINCPNLDTHNIPPFPRSAA